MFWVTAHGSSDRLRADLGRCCRRFIPQRELRTEQTKPSLSRAEEFARSFDFTMGLHFFVGFSSGQ